MPVFNVIHMTYDSETEEFIRAIKDEGGGGHWPFMIPTYDWYGQPLGTLFFLLIVGITAGIAFVVREDEASLVLVISGGFTLLIGTFSGIAWYYASKLLGRRLSDGIQYVSGIGKDGVGWIGCLAAPFLLGGLGFVLTRTLSAANPLMIAGGWVVITSFAFAAATSSLRPPAVLFLAASSQRALVLKRVLIGVTQPLRVISFVKLPKTNVQYLLSSVELNVFRKEDEKDWLRSVEQAIEIVWLVVIDCHTMTQNLVQELASISKKNAIGKSVLLGDRRDQERVLAMVPSAVRGAWQAGAVCGDLETIRVQVRNSGNGGRGWVVFAILMAFAILLILHHYYAKRGF